MRRISYLFTLLLLIVGAVSAYAQTPTATPIAVEEVPEGYYFIASTNESAYGLTNPYIVPNGSAAMKLVSQSDVTTDISTSNVGIWYIKKVEGSGASSKYTIRNIDGLYWVSGPDCPLANRSTNVGYYQFNLTATGANSYYLKGAGGDGNDKITNANPVWASNATTFARTPSTGSTNYDKWKLIPAGVKDITINYTAGSRTISVVKSAVKVGQEISTTFTADFYDSFIPGKYVFSISD
jgi:Tfp pilus assembly protein PilX